MGTLWLVVKIFIVGKRTPQRHLEASRTVRKINGHRAGKAGYGAVILVIR